MLTNYRVQLNINLIHGIVLAEVNTEIVSNQLLCREKMWTSKWDSVSDKLTSH